MTATHHRKSVDCAGNGRILLQAFIEGPSASLAFVADGRRALALGWTRQRQAAPGFRYAGNVLPLDGPAAAFAEASAIARDSSGLNT